MRAFQLFAILTAACGTSTLPPARYRNAEPVRVVDDRRDVSAAPKQNEPLIALYYYDGTFHRRLSRAMELRPPRRALGVNALDEVPDSTWFTNRIGAREVSLDEIRTGAATAGNPEQHAPFTIHSSKSGGRSLGFVVSDARGERFLMKFDERGLPEMETATEIIVGRLLWACGYNVPETHIIYLRRGDLRLAANATTKDPLGNKRRLTQDDVETALARIEIEGDGRIRAVVSRMLDGKPLGGHPSEGTRTGDPNDRIPHELRRDLRATYALFAWLDHVDAKQHNTLDMWVADPQDPSRHYVKHYLLDFGKALGAMVVTAGDPRRGHEYAADFAEMFGALVTGGLQTRTWEGRRPVPLRGVGAFEATGFDPGAWKPLAPVYAPFLLADRFDHFWGAKLAMKFSREQVRAAVEAARLTDPRAVDYLVETIVARQRATGRYWFSRVNPLDRFGLARTAAGTALCFEDLLLSYELSPLAPVTRYELVAHDRHGRRIGAPRAVAAEQTGRTCTPPLAFANDADGYTILRVETRRPNFRGVTFVHVARDPSSLAYRVIGIWRT